MNPDKSPTSSGIDSAADIARATVGLLAALCMSMSSAAPVYESKAKPADASAAQLTTTMLQPQSAHLSCLQTLQRIAAARADMNDAISRNDFSAVGALHEQIKRNFMMTRSQIDDALVRGAWNDRNFKKEASEVLGSLEGMDILNFISLAFLTKYDYPTKKIPASVIDATKRMFTQLDTLIVRIEALNAKVPAVRKAAS